MPDTRSLATDHTQSQTHTNDHNGMKNQFNILALIPSKGDESALWSRSCWYNDEERKTEAKLHKHKLSSTVSAHFFILILSMGFLPFFFLLFFFRNNNKAITGQLFLCCQPIRIFWAEAFLSLDLEVWIGRV